MTQTELADWLDALAVVEQHGIQTLAKARKHYREGLPDGTTCPCCDRFGKVYRRRLGASMCKGLVLAYRYFQEPSAEPWLRAADYFHEHPESSPATRGDFAKLRHWGFIRRNAKDPSLYRITGSGCSFARGETKAPAWVAEYNRQLVGMAPPDERVHITDVIGERFDYDRLMNEPAWIEGPE